MMPALFLRWSRSWEICQNKNWGITPLTRDSEYDNVRPYVPRYQQSGDRKVVLWM